MAKKTSHSYRDVLFNYNGETWEAHEVLGMDKDASEETIKAVLNRRLAEMGPEATPFLNAAANALLKAKSMKS